MYTGQWYLVNIIFIVRVQLCRTSTACLVRQVDRFSFCYFSILLAVKQAISQAHTMLLQTWVAPSSSPLDACMAMAGKRPYHLVCSTWYASFHASSPAQHVFCLGSPSGSPSNSHVGHPTAALLKLILRILLHLDRTPIPCSNRSNVLMSHIHHGHWLPCVHHSRPGIDVLQLALSIHLASSHGHSNSSFASHRIAYGFQRRRIIVAPYYLLLQRILEHFTSTKTRNSYRRH